MTKLLLTQYQMEFEHSNITINDLLDKYSLKLEDLKGHELWVKGSTIVPSIVPDNLPSTNILDGSLDSSEQTLEEQVLDFKEKAMEHCLTFMEKDVRFAEVKEFKDIVSIVDSIDKSLQKGNPDDKGTTINVLVQNITEKFQDDC